MPIVTAILFDLDATLMDSRAVYRAAFASAFEEVLGLQLSDQDEIRYMSLPTTDFLTLYASGSQYDRLAELARDRIDRLLAAARPYDGIETMLQALKQAGISIGVVTSQNQMEIEVSRRILQLDRWIDTWVSVDDVSLPKPAPDALLAALGRLHEAPENGVMIGDSVFDLLAGQAAGMRVAAAAWGALDLAALQALQPEWVFHSPAEVAAQFGSSISSQV